MYEGQFKNDAYEGYGRLFYNGISFYEGFFKNNCYNGRGKYVNQNGLEKIGRFCHNFNEMTNHHKILENKAMVI